jgi:phosphodiesterase/alkaline phosphatase D-like protein
MLHFKRSLIAAALLSTATFANAAPLINGVAAGDVSQTQATLWAKANVAGQLTFELSRNASFSGGIVTSTRTVADATVPAHQNVSGLADGTRYYYRVRDAAGNVSQGTFVTPHAAGRNGLRFGVSGDWRNPQAPFVATSNIDQRDLDFFVALGDTSYTDRPSPAGPPAQNLAEFRMKHAEQLTEKNGINAMVEIRQSTALIAMIDDHEVRDNFAGGAPISTDARFSGTGAPDAPINTSSLYREGIQAFQDYMPIERRMVAGTGNPSTEGRPDLYRSQRYGQDAHVIVPDARSFRDTPLDPTLSPEQTLAAAFEPGRTMLGRHQVSRLKADLLDAQADGVTWKFVMVPEPVQNLGPVNAYDRFEGYAAERTEVLKFIKENDIKNVVFVAADIHGSIMNNLTYQEVNSANPALSFLGPQVKVKSFEVTTGPGAYNNTPFGPTVVELARAAGLISDAQVAFYQSLPIAPDADDLPNDKDDFVRLIMEQQLTAPTPGNRYSPLGLEDSEISFDLMSGDWVMAHLFGWTEFDIDEATQDLLVTVWGLRFDDVIAALGDPDALAALVPQIFAQLRVEAERVPEPAAVGLLVLGLAALALRRRRHSIGA